MTTEEVQSVQPGLYRIHLLSGGTKMAAIGINNKGGRWIAVTEWQRPMGIDNEDQSFWKGITKVKKL